MIGIVLALALSVPIDDQSLGIGVDVLPEAFNYAAGKISFVPNLRLVRCSERDCIWTIGGDVVLTASFLKKTLYIFQIEASWNSEAKRTEAIYRQTCLTIVMLLRPGAATAERQSILKAMNPGPQGAAYVDSDQDDMRFYGSHEVPAQKGAPSMAAHCGAAINTSGQAGRD